MNNQVFYTVVSGTLVFVVGQILQKFVLEPLQQHKKVIGEIDNKLKYYANILTNFGFNDKKLIGVTDIMRYLSCDYESSYKQIPLNKVLSICGWSWAADPSSLGRGKEIKKGDVALFHVKDGDLMYLENIEAYTKEGLYPRTIEDLQNPDYFPALEEKRQRFLRKLDREK